MYENYHVAARIGCLRKYIEHQYVNPRDDSSAYNILSSLVHGRQAVSKDNAGNILLEDNELFEGNNYIKEFISDFDYSNLLI